MELQPEPVLAASAVAARLAAQLSAVQLAVPLDEVAVALPGSTTRASAATLADTWKLRVGGLAGDVDRHAEALRSAVHTFGQVEDEHCRDLHRQRPRGLSTTTAGSQ